MSSMGFEPLNSGNKEQRFTYSVIVQGMFGGRELLAHQVVFENIRWFVTNKSMRPPPPLKNYSGEFTKHK